LNEGKKEQWYTNKEIYEMVQSLKIELRNTQDIVKKYNGIREDVTWCVERLKKFKTTKEAHYTLLEGFREWGGWLVALVLLYLKYAD